MANFLSKLLGRFSAAATWRPPQADDAAGARHRWFLDSLAFYPPRVAPHVGLPGHLTDAQVDENHAWFMRTRGERLDGLVHMLGDAEVDVSALLDAQADPAAAITALRAWIDLWLPQRRHLPCGADINPPERDYLSHPHIGPRIFYAFVGDLATLYGEAIVLRRADFNWGVDRFADSTGMMHHRRTAVLRPPTGGWSSTVLDMELDTLARLYAMRGGGPGVQPMVGDIVMQVVSGALDPR